MARLILHIDDDPQLPAGAVATLEREGYGFARSADPETVMRIVTEQGPALVLMEIDLQSCDGPDLLGGIREVSNDLPILVLTHLSRDSGMHGEAIALGCSDFLTKPVRPADLIAAVREAAPRPPTAAAPDASASGADLSGGIADTPVPELIARLRRRGASGVARLHCGDVHVGLQLRNGTPIRLGSSRTVVDDADAEAELFETFAWTDGSWEFFAGHRLELEKIFELSDDTSDLLARGVIEESPAGGLRERLQKRSTLYVSPAQDATGPLAGVELTAQQREILEEMGGQDSLGDLLSSRAFEERVLYALWVSGRIELHAAPTLDLLEVFEQPAPEPELELELTDEVVPEPEPEPQPELEIDPEDGPQPELEIDPEPEERKPRLQIDPEPGERPELEIDPEPGFVRGARRGERVHAPRPQPRPRPQRKPPERPAPRVAGLPSVIQPPQPPKPEYEDLNAALRELAKEISGDDFEVLGVAVDVSDADLRQAYERQLARIPQPALDSSDFTVSTRAGRIRDRIEAAFAHLSDPESRHAYTLLREEEGQDDAAKTSAKRALEGERWFRKGKGQLEHRRYDEAAEAFGMASHLDPNEGEYQAHLGYALFLSKPGDKVVQREAMEHVANGIKRTPDRELSHVYLGRIMKARGKEVAAIKLFRRALRIRPDCHAAQQELRVIEMRQRKEGKGKGLLSRLLGD